MSTGQLCDLFSYYVRNAHCLHIGVSSYLSNYVGDGSNDNRNKYNELMTLLPKRSEIPDNLDRDQNMKRK